MPLENEVFVRNVEELCKIRGISVFEAMQEAGVSKAYISTLKARGNMPSSKTAQKIANYFGVTTSQLLGEVYIKHSTGRVLMEGGADEPKPVSPGEDGISVEEIRLIRNFRAADPALQEMVRRVLSVD